MNDDAQVALHVMIPEDLRRECKVKAASLGLTLREYVIGALRGANDLHSNP